MIQHIRSNHADVLFRAADVFACVAVAAFDESRHTFDDIFLQVHNLIGLLFDFIRLFNDSRFQCLLRFLKFIRIMRCFNAVPVTESAIIQDDDENQKRKNYIPE